MGTYITSIVESYYCEDDYEDNIIVCSYFAREMTGIKRNIIDAQANKWVTNQHGENLFTVNWNIEDRSRIEMLKSPKFDDYLSYRIQRSYINKCRYSIKFVS